jgi:hypothetical protein
VLGFIIALVGFLVFQVFKRLFESPDDKFPYRLRDEFYPWRICRPDQDTWLVGVFTPGFRDAGRANFFL